MPPTPDLRQPQPARRTHDKATIRAGLILVLPAAVMLLAGCATHRDGQFSITALPPGSVDIAIPEDQRTLLGDLSGPDILTGRPVAITDYPKAVIVINVWSTSCKECRQQAGEIASAASALAGRAEFIGINLDADEATAADFLNTTTIQFPNIHDPTSQKTTSITGSASPPMPMTLILDREQHVARVYLRPVTANELDVVAVTLLTEDAPHNATATG